MDMVAVDIAIRFGWYAVAAIGGGVIAVLGTIIFGKGYKKRIAALEAEAAKPSITQIVNVPNSSSEDERERHLQAAINAETAKGLNETIRSLPQKPLSDGHTYATLPDGTNIVSMADGSYRLALPVRLSVALRGRGEGKASISLTRVPGAKQDKSDND